MRAPTPAEELRRRSAQVLPRPQGCDLTPREWDVALLMAQDLSNGQIADTLGVSLETVKTHVSGALKKLGVEHRTGVVATLYRRGWLPIDLAAGDHVVVLRDILNALTRVAYLVRHGQQGEARELAQRLTPYLPQPKTYAP